MAEQGSYQRIPYLIMFDDPSPYKDTYGGQVGRTVLKAHLLKPDGREADTVLVFMHPIGGGEYLPMPTALARAGHHVIYCQSRYAGNDSALIMEKVAVDMGACVRDARERLGYRKVVLAGWSGGGSLSLFYQAQAERPTVREAPGGGGPDLTTAGLTPADGILLLAAHHSRAHTLTEWMDASILDEHNPEVRDAELDLYHPDSPNQPPYSEAFLQRYRAAQVARNRRITSWVRAKLASLQRQGRANEEYGFVVHGTMADPKWLDASLDPNERKPNWCYLGDPRVVNNGPVGLARFCTLRSWLSQWSVDDSNADGVACGASVTVPALVVGNLADDACTPAHTEALFRGLASRDKTKLEIPGANHYYFGQPEALKQSVAHCSEWLRERGFL